MMQEVGYCSGIENYSRHINGMEPGQTPYTLFDYFPKDFLPEEIMTIAKAATLSIYFTAGNFLVFLTVSCCISHSIFSHIFAAILSGK